MFGTYEQFKAVQEERKQEESEAAIVRPEQSQQLDQVPEKSDGLPQMSFGLPNVIANTEDMKVMNETDGQQVSSVDPLENQPDEPMIEDEDSYRDITPQLKRSTRNKSKSRF